MFEEQTYSNLEIKDFNLFMIDWPYMSTSVKILWLIRQQLRLISLRSFETKIAETCKGMTRTRLFQVQISSSVAVLPALLAKSSICYNPIIYASMNAQFSRFWKNRFFPKTTSKVTTNNTAMITKIEMKSFNRQQQQAKKTNDSIACVSLK